MDSVGYRKFVLQAHICIVIYIAISGNGIGCIGNLAILGHSMHCKSRSSARFSSVCRPSRAGWANLIAYYAIIVSACSMFSCAVRAFDMF